LASNVQGESGYMIFVFIYGILNGGFHYVFKMYIFDISQSRNFNRTWPVVQAAQGLGALIGVPMCSDILNGSALILAAFVLLLGDRYHEHLKVLKKHEEHLKKYHQNPEQNCHSVVIHDNHKLEHNFVDELEVSDDEDEDNEQIHDSIMELYKNRHNNPEALQQWQQIEEELFKKNKDLVQIMKNEIVENVNNVDDPEKKQQALFDLDNIQANNEHLPLKNVRLMRHPSSDEGCYTSSSNTCSSSSSGQPGSKMAAALSHAMVTATLPVARPAPAALPGQNPSKALPNIHSNLKSGWQKQRNITVIEEVSA